MGGNRRRCSQYSNGNITITLLPMLCSKPSIKEVIVPTKWQDRRRLSDEPLSPRVGCMGQVVKRSNNSRVVGHPTPIPLHTPNKYLKLPKIFSVKNTSQRVDANQEERRRRSKIESIADMDPPLPVTRKKPAPESESLWKRRSKGRDAIQLQQIQVAKPHPLQPTSVSVGSN